MLSQRVFEETTVRQQREESARSHELVNSPVTKLKSGAHISTLLDTKVTVVTAPSVTDHVLDQKIRKHFMSFKSSTCHFQVTAALLTFAIHMHTAKHIHREIIPSNLSIFPIENPLMQKWIFSNCIF